MKFKLLINTEIMAKTQGNVVFKSSKPVIYSADKCLNANFIDVATFMSRIILCSAEVSIIFFKTSGPGIQTLVAYLTTTISHSFHPCRQTFRSVSAKRQRKKSKGWRQQKQFYCFLFCRFAFFKLIVFALLWLYVT